MKTSLRILCLLFLSTFTLSLVSQEGQEKVLLSLDDLFSGEYNAKSFGPVHWLADGKAYVVTEPSESDSGKDIVMKMIHMFL